MTHPTPTEIKTDRSRYVPVYKSHNNEERLLHLSATTEEQAIKNAECMGVSWGWMKKHGWSIEKYWESEYE